MTLPCEIAESATKTRPAVKGLEKSILIRCVDGESLLGWWLKLFNGNADDQECNAKRS
jgi:hypothetical protein